MLKAPLLAGRAARRAQHARLAAAALPRTRAGQLGGALRRARDRRDAPLHDRKARRRRHRRANRGAHPSRRHGARGLRQGDARRRDDARSRAARAHRRHGAAAAAGSRAGKLFRRPHAPRTGRSTGTATRRRSTISSARSHRPTRARLRRSPGTARACCGRDVVDPTTPRTLAPALEARDGRLLAHCGGGGTLHVLSLEVDGDEVGAAAFTQRFGAAPAALGGARR